LVIVPSGSEATASKVMLAGEMNDSLFIGEGMFNKGGRFEGTVIFLVTICAENEAACPP